MVKQANEKTKGMKKGLNKLLNFNSRNDPLGGDTEICETG